MTQDVCFMLLLLACFTACFWMSYYAHKACNYRNALRQIAHKETGAFSPEYLAKHWLDFHNDDYND